MSSLVSGAVLLAASHVHDELRQKDIPDAPEKVVPSGDILSSEEGSRIIDAEILHIIHECHAEASDS